MLSEIVKIDDIDELDDDDREIVLFQLSEFIKFLVKLLKRKRPNITENHIQYLLRSYLE